MRSRLLPAALLSGIAAVAVGLMAAGRAEEGNPDPPIPEDRNRSPRAVALSPEGRFAVTANRTAGSVSLVAMKDRKVLAECPVGRAPAEVAWIDPERILVSLARDDAVALLRRDGETLKRVVTIEVGDEPRGLAVLAERAYVALAGVDRVAVVDLSEREVVGRIPVGGVPRTLTVSPNGRWLVTCCNVPGEVWVHEIETGELISRRTIFDQGFNLSRPVALPDSSQVVLVGPVNRTFPVSLANIEKGWVVDNRLSRLPLPDGEYWQQKQLGLDARGNGAGDANALAFSPDGRWLAVSCGGTHELLIIDREVMEWPAADPGDFVPFPLLDTEGALRRVKLGGRPVDVRFLDGRTALVANDLGNSLQIVDVAGAKLTETIDLGGPEPPATGGLFVEPGTGWERSNSADEGGRRPKPAPPAALARRGEAIFYDADRSFDGWFSCHTCHTDGHTCGQTFDTLNDGNYDTYKLTPSLRGVVHTEPWTWHGWQQSLPAQVRKSMHSTLSTQRELSDEDVEAVMAFLATLEHPPSPHREPDGSLTPAAERGRALFEGKAGCANCHDGPHKTTAATYEVGLESNRYFYSEFNPPSLRGLYSRRRFLHDGRAVSLEEVLTRHHRPEDTAGEKLSDEEIRDLIAYLKSL